ncbi:MAG TPA: C1 family peptidase [Gallionella sp.]|nr:C1 family peptidase [Gallionella sp.]
MASSTRKARTSASNVATTDRNLNARPDTLDFRDLMYVPSLVEVGTKISLDSYRKVGVPILDQGTEGACTGFGLATVAHYLLRARKTTPDKKEISPWMLYNMAKRYDEWAGEDYNGSSCRGAMKGWHKHGICSAALWEHDPANPDHTLTGQRADDAERRPLGAYFRVNHKDIVAMHAAITEVGVLYASASVHSGWRKVKKDGDIPIENEMIGGHAFAIVAYDEKGFWIQNSWGDKWGLDGFCRIAYADWLKNGTDVWVARLGVPVESVRGAGMDGSAFTASALARTFSYNEIRPHVISIGNDGQLRTTGNIATTPAQVKKIFAEDFPQITAAWKKPKLVLYAHGGLVGEESSVQRVAEYRKAMLESECYPLAFIWHSDYWSTLKDMLEDAIRRRRPEGWLDSTKDFMLDRLDDALEPIARKLTGKAAWNEMRENAMLATTSQTGGARLVLEEIAKLVTNNPAIEIHIVGHSAGSIFHAPLITKLTATGTIDERGMEGAQGLGLKVESCTLWAPACTMDTFRRNYLPAIHDKTIKRFALYTLTDSTEQDDNCAGIYHKSLLYLVSNAFEETFRIPVIRPDGEPLLGMSKFIEKENDLLELLRKKRIDWVQAPNNNGKEDINASAAKHHGDFDDDPATVSSTLARILGAKEVSEAARQSLSFKSGISSIRNKRERLNLIRG